MNRLALQYLGFVQTPNLWLHTSNFKIQQFELKNTSSNFNEVISPTLRLGKLVERFVSYQLQQDSSVTILLENIQIQNGKITIGELDCLLLKKKQPIHLEIIYKFYLYDATVGTSEIEHFVGPNRNDSLTQKLTKLEEKQLPLLYHEHTKPVLKNIPLEANEFNQSVCFKAQLFIPFSSKKLELKMVNKACVIGYYYQLHQLNSLSEYLFFIPEKRDWLIHTPNPKKWYNYTAFLNKVQLLLDQKKSPLCWIKKNNNAIEKCFVVWW